MVFYLPWVNVGCMGVIIIIENKLILFSDKESRDYNAIEANYSS